MKLEIDITEADLENGLPEDPHSCPIALAFKRLLPGSNPYVNANGISFNIEGEHIDVPVTDAAIRFMDRFDEQLDSFAIEPLRLYLCDLDADEEDEHLAIVRIKNAAGS